MVDERALDYADYGRLRTGKYVTQPQKKMFIAPSSNLGGRILTQISEGIASEFGLHDHEMVPSSPVECPQSALTRHSTKGPWRWVGRSISTKNKCPTKKTFGPHLVHLCKLPLTHIFLVCFKRVRGRAVVHHQYTTPRYPQAVFPFLQTGKTSVCPCHLFYACIEHSHPFQ